MPLEPSVDSSVPLPGSIKGERGIHNSMMALGMTARSDFAVLN